MIHEDESQNIETFLQFEEPDVPQSGESTR